MLLFRRTNKNNLEGGGKLPSSNRNSNGTLGNAA
jgi:hypothetical protein